MSPELLGGLYSSIISTIDADISDFKTVQMYGNQLVDPTKVSFTMPAAFVHMVGGTPTNYPNPKAIEMTMRFVVIVVTKTDRNANGQSLDGMRLAQKISALVHKKRFVADARIRPAQIVDFTHLGGDHNITTYSVQFDQPVIISEA